MKFIVQKYITNDYCHGYSTVMEDNHEKVFYSEEDAVNWIKKNDTRNAGSYKIKQITS